MEQSFEKCAAFPNWSPATCTSNMRGFRYIFFQIHPLNFQNAAPVSACAFSKLIENLLHSNGAYSFAPAGGSGFQYYRIANFLCYSFPFLISVIKSSNYRYFYGNHGSFCCNFIAHCMDLFGKLADKFILRYILSVIFG